MEPDAEQPIDGDRAHQLRAIEGRVRALEVAVAGMRDVHPRLAAVERQQEEDRRMIAEQLRRLEARLVSSIDAMNRRLEARLVSGIDAMNVVAIEVQRDVGIVGRRVDHGVAAVEELSRQMLQTCSDALARLEQKEKTT